MTSELQGAARAGAAAFQCAGWTWWLPEEHTPGVAEIREHLIAYLREAVKDGKNSIECGRLRVERWGDPARGHFNLYLNLGSIWEHDLPSILGESKAP